MNVLLACTVGVTLAAGVYLTSSRDLLRCVIGISVIGVAANLAMFTAARPTTTSAPPLVTEGSTTLGADAVNPLPQALVLTAIVIGFALTCFSLVLALSLQQRTGLSNVDALRRAEPPPEPDGKPPIEDGTPPIEEASGVCRSSR